MLTGWLHARRGTNKIKIKMKIRICTYVYFSLDLLALGALTPALILTLQVVLKYYQGLHEIQSCTCTAGFFFLLSCCPNNNNMVVLAQSTLL